MTSQLRCPKCRLDLMRPSHRRGFRDKVMSMLGLRPVRCLNCSTRTYARLTADSFTEASKS